MINMTNIGKIFKDIRVKKNLSLEYTCDGICSKSTLSRFENNMSDIPLKKFLSLLKKVEISESEFFSYIDKNRELIGSNFLDNVGKLYNNKSTDDLYNLANKLKQKYSESNSKIDFLYYMITVSYYNDLTETLICSTTEVERLYNVLFRTEEWDKLEIESFGNTVTLLNNNLIYHLSVELLDQLDRISRVNFPLYYNSCFTLLNSFQTLILRHSKFAILLDKKLMNYKFEEVNASFNIGLYFMHRLLHSKEDINDLKELKKLIDTLKKANCDTLSYKLLNIFETYTYRNE